MSDPDVPGRPDRSDHDVSGDAIDARLREAGARLRITAPIGRPVSSFGAGRTRWYVTAAAISAVAAAIVAVVVMAPRGDETVQTPADTGPVTVPDTTPITSPDTTPDSITVPSDTTLAPTAIELTEDTQLRNWDSEDGRCYRLRIDWPGAPPEVPMCVTGRQLDNTVEAYVSGDEYAYRLVAVRSADGTVSIESGGGIGAGTRGFLPSTLARCGPPDRRAASATDAMPDRWMPDRWSMVSHCSDGAALVTVLPQRPEEMPLYVVRTWAGDVVEAEFVESIDIDTGEVRDRIEVIEVAPVAVDGFDPELQCILVVPASSERWFEACGTSFDPPAWNSLFIHAGMPYMLHQSRIIALPIATAFSTNGCSSAVVDVLAAMDEPSGMLGSEPALVVTGLACAAPTDPRDLGTTDIAASAAFSGVHLRAGPRDGGLVVIERTPGEVWQITDTGTGIEPDPWPLPIPPFEWITIDSSVLPPFDGTASVRDAIPGTASITEMEDAIAAYLAEWYPVEGGPEHRIVPVEDVPLVMAPDVRYLDDSVGSGTFAFWIGDRDGVFVIERVYVTNRCSRGVTESDGGLLCV